MRSPVPNSALQTQLAASETVSETANQQEEDHNAESSSVQVLLDKTESDSDSDEQETASVAVAVAGDSTTEFAASSTSRRADTSVKRGWRSARRQLLERTRRRLARPSLEEQQSYESDSFRGRETAASPGRQRDVQSFAVEIESEAAEIRTLIARTARLWSAVDRAERADDTMLEQQQLQHLESVTTPNVAPTSALLSEEYTCAEEVNEDSTLSGDEEEYEGEDEEEDDTETESIANMEIQSGERGGYHAEGVMAMVPVRQASNSQINRMIEQQEDYNVDTGADGDDESEGLRNNLEENLVDNETDDLTLEQGEVMDASNRAINASKARAIKNAMLGNLLRLGFRENIARAALEAGVLEIDHYDADCELAYVDIFMSLVKMVCDAHVDVMNGGANIGENWAVESSQVNQGIDAVGSHSLEQRSFLPFKWPVFDMAQFEFGNARQGTCFNSVCVLTNLPKVSMDRTEELMELLSCNLFCMIGDPIQVVIPSASSTGRTKGHAFLEFDDPDMAKRCASAIDGLTWGRGPFGRIRGNLFRQYQVKSPAEQCRQTQTRNSHEAFAHSFAGTREGEPFIMNEPAVETSRLEGAAQFPPAMKRYREVQQQNLFCDSDEESSDEGEWVISRPLEYGQFNSASLQDLSSDSIDIREQHELDHEGGVMMQLGWDDDVLNEDYSARFSRDTRNGRGNDESFDSNSVLELQALDEEKFQDQSLFNELLQGTRYNDARCNTNSPTQAPFLGGDGQAESLAVSPPASAAARDASIECGVMEQPWEVSNEGDDDVEKPWQRYCEDLIIRNREMQEQVALARRRIVQLSHNNQKLHLLIDRVERDRDGLLFENDLLQTQLHGYEDHEEHHDSLMKELITLRKRLKQKEQTFDLKSLDPHQQFQTAYTGVVRVTSSPLGDIRSVLHHLSSQTLAGYKMAELKECEQFLENTLGRVRSAKEEKALEMQKKLDRQVEEQNELKLCVICLSNEKTILCLPCRHLCLCKACSRREEVAKCPICRLEIEEMLAVYS